MRIKSNQSGISWWPVSRLRRRPRLQIMKSCRHKQTDQSDLYTFRHSIEAPPEALAAAAEEEPAGSLGTILVVLAFLALIGLAFLWRALVASSRRPPAPTSIWEARDTIQRGSSGRLIARWDRARRLLPVLHRSRRSAAGRELRCRSSGSAAASSRSTLRYSTILTASSPARNKFCFPLQWPTAQARIRPAPREPRQTQTGDNMQNMAGDDGQIAEIDLTGPLPCRESLSERSRAGISPPIFQPLPSRTNGCRHEKAAECEERHGGRISGLFAAY